MSGVPVSTGPLPIAAIPTDPVRFDDATAARLGQALQDLAAELTRFVRGREDRSSLAGRDWSGYSRTWFDRRFDVTGDLARSATSSAEIEAEAVGRARAWAAAEQLRRDQAAAAAATAATAATAGAVAS